MELGLYNILSYLMCLSLQPLPLQLLILHVTYQEFFLIFLCSFVSLTTNYDFFISQIIQGFN